VPLGTEPNQLIVQVHTDAAAHADDEGFALHYLEPLLEMVCDVLRDKSDALLRTNQGFKPCPLRPELLPYGLFFSFSDLFKLWVYSWLFLFVEIELRQSCLVVYRNGSPSSMDW
jgi:hypothetical protein